VTITGVQCPEDHPEEFLYYRRIPDTPDTIICCRKCDRETCV